ncbi:MAG: hypothetical protein IPN40_15705 [Uliginosibacterium sp.]|nr:hypothetical protein [Uliginosibacterium sp.]
MSSLYPDRGNFAAVVGRVSDVPAVRRVKALMQGATDLPIYSINAPEAVKGIDFSDHRNYWRIGVPALMVTDTAFFRNPNYHEPEDTAETLITSAWQKSGACAWWFSNTDLRPWDATGKGISLS